MTMPSPVKIEVVYWQCDCGRLYWGNKAPKLCVVCKKSDPRIFKKRTGTVEVTPYE